MPEKMDYILIGLGVLAAVLVSSYVPGLVKAAGPTSVRMDFNTTYGGELW